MRGAIAGGARRDQALVGEVGGGRPAERDELAAGARGNVRTETMRAFTEDEAKAIAAEL